METPTRTLRVQTRNSVRLRIAPGGFFGRTIPPGTTTEVSLDRKNGWMSVDEYDGHGLSLTEWEKRWDDLDVEFFRLTDGVWKKVSVWRKPRVSG